MLVNIFTISVLLLSVKSMVFGSHLPKLCTENSYDCLLIDYTVQITAMTVYWLIILFKRTAMTVYWLIILFQRTAMTVYWLIVLFQRTAMTVYWLIILFQRTAMMKSWTPSWESSASWRRSSPGKLARMRHTGATAALNLGKSRIHTHGGRVRFSIIKAN